MWATQTNDIEPGPTLVANGIPKVPVALASSIKGYTTAFGLPMAAWSPSKHEVWLKDLASKKTVISRVGSPGDNRQTMDVIPTGGIYDLYFDPSQRYVIYNKDTDGNEVFQMYLYDLKSHKTSVLTDGKSRNTEPVWSNKGDRIIYSSSPIGSNGVSLFVTNPFKQESNRLLAKSTGTYFKAFDWSPNDSKVVFCDFASNASSTLWLI
jgi:Tol biopolymer transport system component